MKGQGPGGPSLPWATVARGGGWTQRGPRKALRRAASEGKLVTEDPVFCHLYTVWTVLLSFIQQILNPYNVQNRMGKTKAVRRALTA